MLRIKTDSHRDTYIAVKVQVLLAGVPVLKKQCQQFFKSVFMYRKTGYISNKLITAYPYVDCFWKSFLKTLGEGYQYLVSKRMTVLVVVDLKVINIHGNQDA